jgi:multimeric flavodoxin WrbA
MKITCISASNTKLPGGNSTSVNVCNMMKEMLLEDESNEIAVDIVPLKDYDLKPCTLCGSCYQSGRCIYDEEFNKLLTILEDTQGILLVVPHYSPIPAKLMIIFEKINEITYAGWINNPEYQSPFYNKPVGIIGHGGMTENEDTLRYYHDHLVTPVANTLKSLSFSIVKYNDDFPNGITFGLKDDTCIRKADHSIFPDIIQDWPKIKDRIKPLVINMKNASTL